MADHAHKQIRDALKTRLTGLASTGARVYANRLYPLTAAELPALRVYLDEESAEPLSVHAPASSRVLSLSVEACAKATAALDDTLDQIGKEVEIALASGLSVAGVHLQPIYTGMSFTDDIADQPVGVKRMTFSLPFEAAAGAPDVLL